MSKEDVINQLNEMEELITAATSAPMTEVPADDPITDAPTTDMPSTKSPVTELPSTEVPITELPVEEPTEFQKLCDKITELESMLKEKDKAPSTTTPSTEAPIKIEDFLGEVDLDELTMNKDALNAILNKVYIAARKEARKEAITERQGILMDIPSIVKNNIEIVTSLKKASEDFYENNPDLVPFKKVVSTVFDEIVGKDPNRSYQEILKEIGPEVRKRLDLKKEAIKQSGPPKLTSKKSALRTKTKQDVDPFLNEISEMDNALNN